MRHTTHNGQQESNVPVDLENEIVSLRSELADKTAEATRLRTEADEVVARVKGEGGDPLGKDFAQVDEAYTRADAARDAVSEVQTRMARALSIVGERADERKDSVETREARTLADALIRSDEYQALLRSDKLRRSNTHISTDPVEIATRDDVMDSVRARTITNATPGGGGLVWSDRLNLVVGIGQRRVRLLDAITVGETDSDTIEWAVQTVHSDAAAETAYGTDAPEADYKWDKESTTVKRVPHFAATTRGVIADAGQLSTLMGSNLVNGTLRRIERQVAYGDGAGENLVGFLDSSVGIGGESMSTDSRWDSIHKAITRIRIQTGDAGELEPGHVMMNPVDYEKVLLEKEDSSSNNYSNQRGMTEPGSIWGLTPIVTTLAPSGTVIVGDFSQVFLWFREGLSLAFSTEHSDFFRKGLVAAMVESRVATACVQPLAFEKVTSFS